MEFDDYIRHRQPRSPCLLRTESLPTSQAFPSGVEGLLFGEGEDTFPRGISLVLAAFVPADFGTVSPRSSGRLLAAGTLRGPALRQFDGEECRSHASVFAHTPYIGRCVGNFS